MSVKNRKLQVFVSSTFLDLREERQAAVEAILSTGNIPAGMELFAAGDQSQMEVIKDWIHESDVYMLILGGRYGAIEPKSGKSYTQLEYEYALEIGKAHFAVVTSEKALEEKVKKHGLEMTERSSTEKYNEFKKLVTRAKLVRFWEDVKDIKISIHETISNFNKREELIGWIRGGHSFDAGLLAEEISKLSKENSELRNMIKKLEKEDTYGNKLSFDEIFDILGEIQVKKYNSEVIMDGNAFIVAHQNVLTGYEIISRREVVKSFSIFPTYGLITLTELKNGTGYFNAKFTPKGNMYLHYLINKLKEKP